MPELVRLVATARQKYRGRWYCAGDQFDATRSDASDLVAIRFAALVVDEPKVDDVRRYKRRDMEPER